MAGERLRVFVACGTGLRFKRLLDAVRGLADLSDVELFVQRGEAAADDGRLPGSPSVSRTAFADRLQWADVVICHGGAGTLQQTLAAGHRPWVMPRLAAFGEHVNDHQLELVRALGARGLARELDRAATRADLELALSARSGHGPLCARSLELAVAAALRRDSPRGLDVRAALTRSWLAMLGRSRRRPGALP